MNGVLKLMIPLKTPLYWNLSRPPAAVSITPWSTVPSSVSMAKCRPAADTFTVAGALAGIELPNIMVIGERSGIADK